uniref:Pulmonary surfactant-associated protein D n=1 Tax=Magallana gigas TaxID=29159 RepID=K1QEQ5_MAGGI
MFGAFVFIGELRLKISKAYIHNFWLDANDIEREGHFIWQSTRQPLVYKNWNPNEPSGGTEDCLEMLFKEYVDEQHIGQWNDKICNKPVKAFRCVFVLSDSKTTIQSRQQYSFTELK